MPSLPWINPAVGKSGPGINFISSFMVVSGLFMRCTMASMTSERLWGGILVAMPTAIPDEPFTSRFGNAAGITRGSFKESS